MIYEEFWHLSLDILNSIELSKEWYIECFYNFIKFIIKEILNYMKICKYEKKINLLWNIYYK